MSESRLRKAREGGEVLPSEDGVAFLPAILKEAGNSENRKLMLIDLCSGAILEVQMYHW